MRTKKVIAGLLAAATLASVSVSAIVSAQDGFGVGISNTTAESPIPDSTDVILEFHMIHHWLLLKV